MPTDGTDTTIFIGLFSFFLLFGIIAPVMNAEFQADIPDATSQINNIENARRTIDNNIFSQLGIIWAMIVSILSASFWSIGAGVPIWLNMILIIPRAMYWIIIIRWLRELIGFT